MNDFTKKELQYLLEMVDSILIANRSVNSDELQEKIQSMVDNYDYQVIKVWHCEKCGHVQ